MRGGVDGWLSNAVQQVAEQAGENGVAAQASKATVENAVAEVTVGGATTQYANINEAFNAAQQENISATVKLLGDATVSYTSDGYGTDKCVYMSKSGNAITLDLNGHTLTAEKNNNLDRFGAMFFLWGTSLTIQDTSNEKNGKIVQVNGVPAITVIQNGSLTVESGTIENTASSDRDSSDPSQYSCAVLAEDSTVTIKGGTMKGLRGVVVDADNNSLTVTDGSFEGTSGNALFVNKGSAALSGGTYSATSNDHSIWVADGTAASLLANGYRYQTADGVESAYSDNGNGVVGNAEVKQRPANEYAYIDADGKEKTQANCTEVTEKTEDIAGNGWYVAKNNVTISNLNISGQINLILCDGAELTVSSSMNVTNGASLNLYWQSAGSGKLIAETVSGKDAIIAPAGEMKETAGESGTTFEKCLTHDWGYTNNGSTHTAKCKLCNKDGNTTAHSYTDWSSNGVDDHAGKCVCGAEGSEPHALISTPNGDGLTHSSKCGKCGYVTTAENHSFSLDDEWGKKCACGAYPTASYNGTDYASVANAVAAAKDGGAVKLLKDVGENIIINDGIDVTIDLNGKTWTTDGAYAHATLTVNGGRVTVKNGTLETGSSSNAYTTVVINGGSLIIGENMAIWGNQWDVNRYRPAIEAVGGELALTLGTKLYCGMSVPSGKTLADYLPDGTAFNDGNSLIDGYVQEKIGNFTLTVVEHQQHSNSGNLVCACGAGIAAAVKDLQQSTVYGWYTTLEEAFASVKSDEERYIQITPGTHALGEGASVAASIFCGLYDTGKQARIEVENHDSVTIENGGFFAIMDGLYVSAVKVKNGGGFDSGGIVGVLSLEDGCKTFQSGRLTRGTFGKIVIDGNGKKLSDALYSGLTFRHTDNSTWATDEELAGTEIENVSVVKKPFYGEKITVSPGNELSYQDSLEVTLTASKTDQGDYGDTTYEWFATDNPTQVLSSEAAYTRVLSEAGSYTFGCRITRDGYTREVFQEIVVKKGVATCTAEPQAVSGLVYNGNKQALVTAGSANGGTMQYSLEENGTYSADIPTATDAGGYTVWYKVVGDKNYNDSVPASVKVTIAQADPIHTAPTSVTATYGQKLSEIQLTNPEGNTPGTWAWADNAQAVGDIGNNAFKAIFTPTDVVNFKTVSDIDVTVSVTRAAGNVTAPVAKTLTYNGEDQELVSAAISETGTVEYSLGDSNVWQENIPTAKNTGKYIVHYRVIGDRNHNDVIATGVTVTITPAPVTITVKDKSVYVGDAAPDLGNPKEGTDYEVSGLMGKDELTTAPVLKYVGITDVEPITPDTSKTGEVARIAASDADAGGNYEFTYAPGKLTVSSHSVALSPSPKPTNEPISITLENDVVDGSIIIKNAEDAAHEYAPIKIEERFEEFEERVNRSLFDIIDKIMKHGYGGLGPDNFTVVNSVPLKDLEGLTVDIEYKAEQYANNHDAESSLHPLAQASNDLTLGDGYELDGDAYTIQIAVKAGDKLIGYLTGFDLTVAYEASERDASYTYTLLGGRSVSYDAATGTYTFIIESGKQFAVARIANVTLDKRALAKVSDSKTVKVKAGKGAKLQLKAVTSESGDKVSYKKKSGSKKVKVSKSGKVTIAKGLKPGKKYVVAIKATVGKATKTIKLAIRVAKAKKTKK